MIRWDLVHHVWYVTTSLHAKHQGETVIFFWLTLTLSPFSALTAQLPFFTVVFCKPDAWQNTAKSNMQSNTVMPDLIFILSLLKAVIIIKIIRWWFNNSDGCSDAQWIRGDKISFFSSPRTSEPGPREGERLSLGLDFAGGENAGQCSRNPSQIKCNDYQLMYLGTDTTRICRENHVLRSRKARGVRRRVPFKGAFRP